MRPPEWRLIPRDSCIFDTLEAVRPYANTLAIRCQDFVHFEPEHLEWFVAGEALVYHVCMIAQRVEDVKPYIDVVFTASSKK